MYVVAVGGGMGGGNLPSTRGRGNLIGSYEINEIFILKQNFNR